MTRLFTSPLVILLLGTAALPLHAQVHAPDGIIRLEEIEKPKQRKLLNIPSVNGYQALKCDFHMHTVFTDGHVWPNVRVQEAWQEGLDAFAFTEHVEYAPHKVDVTEDVSRSYELAKDLAKDNKLTLIKGVEITRDTPPGHFNALFIGDTSGYVADRSQARDKEAIEKAVAQNAFIFWNHPGWKAREIKGSYEWTPFVDELFRENKLHGIEVANGHGIHVKAIDWALDRNLTIIGNSDIHNLVAHEYDLDRYDGHRTMTLVFAKNSSPDAIREALQAGRTVAWAGKYLIGKEDHVRGLFEASVSLKPSHSSRPDRSGKVQKLYELVNDSDLCFDLVLKKGKGTRVLKLQPSSSLLVSAPEGAGELVYEVTNTLIRSDKHLNVSFRLK
jgi:hypothetical protein